jgi:hypothetical protein
MREIMIVKLKLQLIGIWGTCWPDSGIYELVRPRPTWSSDLLVYYQFLRFKKVVYMLKVECII